MLVRSENLGGALSFVGSSVFIMAGGTIGILIASLFLSAELALTFKGHKRAGYSLGCGLLAIGDFLAAFSKFATDNDFLKVMFVLMALVWLIGAVRGPLVWYARRLNKDNHSRLRIYKSADRLQNVVGVLVLGLRVPGIVAAVMGDSFLAVVSLLCWAISDILLGRLQITIAQLYARRQAAV